MILRDQDWRNVISLIDRCYPFLIYLVLLGLIQGCEKERDVPSTPRKNSHASVSNPERGLTPEKNSGESVVVPVGAAPVVSVPTPMIADSTYLSQSWVVSREFVGMSVPVRGRSLFDHLFKDEVPYPFEKVLDRVAALTGKDAVKVVLIPIGRSLQRNSAHPDFFKFPRVVVAVNDDPGVGKSVFAMKDKLFLGFNERAETIEAISFNDSLGRFEFQIVENYARGKTPKVFYADRSVCIECHQNHAGIFSKEPWRETNQGENTEVIGYLKANMDGDYYHGSEWFPLEQKKESVVRKLDESTDRSNLVVLRQRLWDDACYEPKTDCRKLGIHLAILYGLGPASFDAASVDGFGRFSQQFDRHWKTKWPSGLKLADPDIPNRNPLDPLKEGNQEIHLPVDVEAEADRVEEISKRRPNIDFDDDPLKIRQPLALLGAQWGGPWNFVAGHDAIYKEWSNLLSSKDYIAIEQTLKRFLLARSDGLQEYTGDCLITIQSTPRRPWNQVLKGKCEKTSWSFEFRLKVYDGGAAKGYLQDLEVGDAKLDLVQVAGELGDDGTLDLEFATDRNGTSRRLSSGETFDRFRIVIGRADREEIKGQVNFVLLDVSDALASILGRVNESFTQPMFSRRQFLKEFFAAAGDVETSKKFDVSEAGFAPAQMTHSASLPDFFEPFEGKFGELQTYCVRCHGRAHNKDLPQFLFGRFEQVKRKMLVCAPRMYFRLMMWNQILRENALSKKSVMPPKGFLNAKKIKPEDWDSKRVELVKWLESEYLGIDSDEARDSFFRKSYSSLPECHF